MLGTKKVLLSTAAAIGISTMIGLGAMTVPALAQQAPSPAAAQAMTPDWDSGPHNDHHGFHHRDYAERGPMMSGGAGPMTGHHGSGMMNGSSCPGMMN